MALLDAVRLLSDFDPPRGPFPDCDLGELADVLDAHGLAPLASYNLENRLLGAGLPDAFRERLLGHYQGVVNDNVFKLVELRGGLKSLPADLPIVLLEAAAYMDWLYPHVAFRPLAYLRLAVRGEDGARFAAALSERARPVSTGPGGHTATFSLAEGRISLELQEGLVAGRAEDGGLFERATPVPVFGPGVRRPTAEDALLLVVADQALAGLSAPLITFVDLRELVRQEGLDVAAVRARARALGLSRALFGSLTLLAHFFPGAGERAALLRPELPSPERAAVEAVIAPTRDPANLRRLRGSEALARGLLLGA